ncbi:MAG: PilN domain-containing protein [Bacillota bacterium]
MIRINLLIKPPPQVRWRVVIRIAVLFLVVAMAAISAIGWMSNLRKIERQVAETKRLMADYDRVGARLPEVRSKLEEIQAREAVVAEFGRNQRFSQSAVLQGILVTPPEVWVTNVAFADDTVVITGESRSFAGAMQYLALLRASPLLRGVDEKNLRTIETGATHFIFSARTGREVKKP